MEKGKISLASLAAASSSKLNANAPEFVPKTTSPPHNLVANCFQFYDPWFHFAGNGVGRGDNRPSFYIPEENLTPHQPIELPKRTPKYGGNAPDSLQKIVKQVEYQFSDANLGSNEQMMKLIHEDPEGYVPIATLVPHKKIKSIGSNNFMLSKALKLSPKLVVSEDGRRVKRKEVLTEKDKDDAQARTVIVENLPEGNSRQDIEKMFSVVGRVKSVRICSPRDQNTARHTKSDILISNKTHALVEYETTEIAEKAAETLNDERDWRKGLRVRMMLRSSPRSVVRNKREEYDCFDEASDEDDRSATGQFNSPRTPKNSSERNNRENSGGFKRNSSHGRGKSTYAGSQSHNGNGILSPVPQGSQLVRHDPPGKHGTRKAGAANGSGGILSAPGQLMFLIARRPSRPYDVHECQMERVDLRWVVAGDYHLLRAASPWRHNCPSPGEDQRVNCFIIFDEQTFET